jgi:N-acetylglutamate synthase-like GNAT family acetyltransferase/predicted metal-dependent hydrolase
MSKKSAKIAAMIEGFRGRKLDAHYYGYFKCFNDGLYYEAHDVLEELWLANRRAPDDHFYKGLIQLAGAFVHLQKDRLGPANALFNLAQSNLQKYPPHHESLHVAGALKLIQDWRQKLSDHPNKNPLPKNPPPTLTVDELEFSTDRSRLDIELIHDFLGKKSYWAKNVSREIVERSIQNSLCFGVYRDTRQIAFARVISDFATFAYLADVFVLPDERGKGVSKFLIANILAHPQLQGLRRFFLATEDAQGLYSQFGFEPITHPERFMTIHRPNIYDQAPQS